MGGYGSGRPAKWGYIESLPALRTKVLKDAGCFDNPMEGTINLGGDEPYQLRTRQNQVQIGSTPINIIRTPTQFGGSRAWFQCPGCRDKTTVLYGKDDHWLCRKHWTARYMTQQMDPLEKLWRKADKIRRKLGQYESQSRFDRLYWPPQKPKWMRQATYQKLKMQLWHVELRATELNNAGMQAIVDRIKPR